MFIFNKSTIIFIFFGKRASSDSFFYYNDYKKTNEHVYASFCNMRDLFLGPSKFIIYLINYNKSERMLTYKIRVYDNKMRKYLIQFYVFLTFNFHICKPHYYNPLRRSSFFRKRNYFDV